MNLFNVKFNLDGRSIEALVKEGVLATIEIGSHADRVKKPEHKISIIAGRNGDGPCAWVQVAKFASGAFSVTHEGWTSDEEVATIGANVELAEKVDDLRRRQVEKAEFGTSGCCTAYGNGCYVTCCNSCCADPTRCPGASCCG